MDGRSRVAITNTSPIVEEGKFPIKRIIGDEVTIEVDAFCDGKDQVVVLLCFRKEGDPEWQEQEMFPLDNDRWQGSLVVDSLGCYQYTFEAWVHPHRQWATKYEKTLLISVEPRLARFSAWYEFFPRSSAQAPKQHGTLQDCILRLQEIASLGFDVVYLPPIHPIGTSHRKGKNNSLQALPDDPGSPWAIGSKEGGHKAIHPRLGTFDDFAALIACAKEHRLQIALDLAFQCSPDHPYITEHPEWFSYRPDGTIKHAENPPKKYEDIVPFNFECESYQELWQELASIVFFWIERGCKCFRVDNPHTKPFLFWHWLITTVKKEFPEVIFLSEAFTRPKVMHWLSKLGFSQSYTYFTWRYAKKEMIRAISELTCKDVSEYFRPNLWPNTPDILPLDLQYDGKAAFMYRLILAATLSSNYGIYGPPFEHMVTEAIPNSEEYQNAEKYEIVWWDQNKASLIKELMAKINQIRRKNPALQRTNNVKFYEIDNAQLLYYTKFASESLLIAINMDPFEVQSGILNVPKNDLGIPDNQSYHVHELLQDKHFFWEDAEIPIKIDPELPCRIYKIATPMHREKGFEYFM